MRPTRSCCSCPLRARRPVDVVAAPPPAAAPSAVVVTPAEVLRTPGALDNVFRTLQTLPGVSAAEEFSSRWSSAAVRRTRT